ncbi:MAG: hypothetical protein LQ342_005328 [Letrouitia transgressa]|nr:MAG: hypothetical protein LQ342_005328 [Letrouitia transgressa]
MSGESLSARPYLRTVYLCALLRALATFSAAVSQVSRLRLLESNVCRSFYRSNNPTVIDKATDTVPEAECKGSTIQAQLAFLLGWDALFQNIPVLMVGLIYAVLSSRVNRKLLLCINISSNIAAKLYYYCICYFYNTFDIRLIWLSSLFDLVGGGKIVFDTLTLAVIAETVQTSSLSSFYFYISSVLTALRMIGFGGGAFLMKHGYWLPIGIGFGVWCTTLPTVLFLRITPKEIYQSLPTDSIEEYQLETFVIKDDASDSGFESGSENVDDRNVNVNLGKQGRQGDDDKVSRIFSGQPETRWKDSLRHTLVEANIYRLALSVFFIHELAMGIRDVAEQWVSKRYHLPLQNVSYILSGETLLNAIILFMLPKLSGLVARKWELAPGEKDLFVASTSVLTAATGALFIAASWNIPLLLVSMAVFASGVGFHDALKSYVVLLIGAEHAVRITRIYMCISILEVLANMVNGPLWAEFYQIGLNIEGVGLALPFILCSSIFLSTWLFLRRLN